MEVLREEGAKSKNRVPGIVEAGALAIATTVTPHNPTFDLRPSCNEEYIDEKLIGHKPQIPVEPPIERKMNTSTRFMIVSLLPILIPIYIFVFSTTAFIMGKSKKDVIEQPQPSVQTTLESLKQEISDCEDEILDLDSEITSTTRNLQPCNLEGQNHAFDTDLETSEDVEAGEVKNVKALGDKEKYDVRGAKKDVKNVDKKEKVGEENEEKEAPEQLPPEPASSSSSSTLEQLPPEPASSSSSTLEQQWNSEEEENGNCISPQETGDPDLAEESEEVPILPDLPVVGRTGSARPLPGSAVGPKPAVVMSDDQFPDIDGKLTNGMFTGSIDLEKSIDPDQFLGEEDLKRLISDYERKTMEKSRELCSYPRERTVESRVKKGILIDILGRYIVLLCGTTFKLLDRYKEDAHCGDGDGVRDRQIAAIRNTLLHLNKVWKDLKAKFEDEEIKDLVNLFFAFINKFLGYMGNTSEMREKLGLVLKKK